MYQHSDTWRPVTLTVDSLSPNKKARGYQTTHRGIEVPGYMWHCKQDWCVKKTRQVDWIHQGTCSNMNKSDRCYQFQRCSERPPTAPAITGKDSRCGAQARLQPEQEDAELSSRLSTVVPCVFHLLLQKCASVEYQWPHCIYPLQGCLRKWTEVLAKAAFRQVLGTCCPPSLCTKIRRRGGSGQLLRYGP